MNSLHLLYQWTEELDKRFPQLGRWQVLGLALFSYGVVLAQSCTLSRVARSLSGQANSSSLERRLQRFLANGAFGSSQIFPDWIAWVSQLWGQGSLAILIDETKLSDHLAVMMVGVAYRQSAIPLLWRPYVPSDYPALGQVALMSEMLAQLRDWLPSGRTMILLADRGLGTSPEWQAQLEALGWDYLLRVQRTVLIRLPNHKPQPLRRLVGCGQRWSGWGDVFKNGGWQHKWVFLVWEVGYAQPWCLFSNQPWIDPLLYSVRFHHEASFRDLKSDGFHWQRSRVWLPAHAERLLLVLACATLWALTEGTKALHMYPLTRRQHRLSPFRLGLDYLFEHFVHRRQSYLDFFLVPDTPFLKTVVT